MYTSTDDYTNVFGFIGNLGIGPGNHAVPELVTYTEFKEGLVTLNKFSYLSYYQYMSDEPHQSIFWGSVVFKQIDSTMSGFLPEHKSNFGIDLEVYTSDLTTPNTLFDTSTNILSIPVVGELVFDPYDPYVYACIESSDLSVARFTPEYISYGGADERVINFYLVDVVDGTYMTYSQFNTFADSALTINLFGYRTIFSEDL